MSSISKSLNDGKRNTSSANGVLSSSAGSRIPSAPCATGASSLGRKTRLSQQKALLAAQPGSDRAGVTSPPAPRPTEPHYASVRRADLARVVGQAPGIQSHQGNQTYTLIAYQPNQSDPQRKTQNQPAVLYAVPSNHALLQQHQIQQLLQQQQHSTQLVQTSSSVASAAVLVPPARAGHPHPPHNPPSCDGTQKPPSSHRPGELVCTCPPELHQALIEQQQQQQQQRQGQQQQQNYVVVNRDLTTVQLPEIAHADRNLNTSGTSQPQCPGAQCAHHGQESRHQQTEAES
uniref:Polyhomeotic-like protein 2 n=1 Tax=Mesocestoides corti TaxID=53468 RepID=A0A5K3FJK5_MESCO